MTPGVNYKESIHLGLATFLLYHYIMLHETKHDLAASTQEMEIPFQMGMMRFWIKELIFIYVSLVLLLLKNVVFLQCLMKLFMEGCDVF
jgi:hypothetical protein